MAPNSAPWRKNKTCRNQEWQIKMESLNKKKNALDFAMFLKEIGYSSTARAQDFEWLFDYPSTRPFLKFLASSISSSKNVLSSDEVAQYDAILVYFYC